MIHVLRLAEAGNKVIRGGKSLAMVVVVLTNLKSTVKKLAVLMGDL